MERAIEALLGGDVAALAAELDAAPALVGARAAGVAAPYDGYFAAATLLHHVAGNPSIRPLPGDVVDKAALLLDRGAEVDAVTAPGPSQPHDLGWTTLGLVATSLEARRAGVQRALLELLVARGADLDARGGGPLVGAIYYGELDAARWLVARGARCDLVTAAGVGAIDRMARFVDGEGRLAADAHVLVHYSQVRERPRDAGEILGLALVFACLGRARDAAAWLLDRGAAVNARPPFDHRATPLHWAALRGDAEVAELLLAGGADRDARDATWDATPAGWARHLGHDALAARLA